MRTAAMNLPCDSLPNDSTWQLNTSAVGTTFCGATNITFSVSSDSTYEAGILSFQWQRKVGAGSFTNVGVDNDSLTTSVGTTAQYRCIVSCGNGSNAQAITLGPVAITINDIPSIAPPAATAALCAGSTLNPTAPAVTNNGAAITAQGWQLETAVGSNAFNALSVPYTVVFADNNKKLRYTATNACGTANSSTVTLTVNDDPAVAAPATPAALCAGSSLNPTAPSVTNNGAAITAQGWQLETAVGSNSFNALTVPYTVAFADNNKKVRYTATNACGTVNSTSVTLTVNDDPIVAAPATPAALCTGSTLNPIAPSITNNGAAITAQGWQLETAVGSNSFNALTVPYTVAFADNGKKLRHTATNACGTVNSSAVTLTVTATNTAGSPSSNPTVCVGLSISPITIATTGAIGIGTPSGLPPGVNALWTANVITLSGTPTTDGVFSYTIPLSGGCGTVNATGTITVLAVTANFASNSTTVCAGQTASLTVNGTIPASANDILVTYSIAGGTGQPLFLNASGQGTISVPTTAQGTISVALLSVQRISAPGCSSNLSATATVNVIALPSANFSSPTSHCSGSPYTLQITGTPNATIHYTLGGQSQSAVTLNNSGSASVGNLTLGNGNNAFQITQVTLGSCSNNTVGAVFNVNVTSTPSVTITPIGAPDAILCPGESVTLGSSTVGSAYTWRRGTTVVGSESTITVTQTGNYTVEVTAGTCGGTSSPFVVSQGQVPTANISASGPITFCEGGSVNLTANASSCSDCQFTWSTLFIGSMITVNSDATVTVTATNADGCTDTSNATVVNVNPIPEVTITSQNPVICSGQSTALLAQGAATYVWQNSTGATIGTASEVTVSTSGNFQVTGTASGCSSSASTTVTVLSVPSGSITGSTSICADSSAVISITGTPGATAFYRINNGSEQQQILDGNGNASLSTNPSFSGSSLVYTLDSLAIIQSGRRCSATSSGTVTVNILQRPVLQGIANVSYCNGAQIQPIPLNETATSPVQAALFHWEFEDFVGMPDGSSTSQISSTQEAYAFNNPNNSSPACSVWGVSSAGCISDTVQFTLTVTPGPVITAVSDVVLCDGDNFAPITFSTDIPATLTWTAEGANVGLPSQGGAQVIATTGNLTYPAGANGTQSTTIMVFAETSAGCTSDQDNPVSFDVTVVPNPISTTAATFAYCDGDNATIEFSSELANQYDWSLVPGGDNIGISGQGIDVDSLAFLTVNPDATERSAIIHLIPKFDAGNGLTTCPGEPQDITIFINPTPTIEFGSFSTFCSGATLTEPSINLQTVPTGSNVSYTWQADNTSGLLQPSDGVEFTNVLTENVSPGIDDTNVDFTPVYAAHGTSCPGDMQTIVVVVNPLARVNSIPGDAQLCSGETASIGILSQTNNPSTEWTVTVPANSPVNGGSNCGNCDVSDVLTYADGEQQTLTYTISPELTSGQCPGEQVQITFTVFALPGTPSLLDESSPDPCAGAQGVELWADTTAEGVTLYEWTIVEPNPNGWTLDYGGTAGDISGSTAYVNVPAAGGTFTYQLAAENANDCRSYAQFELVVDAGAALPNYDVVIVNAGMLAVVPALSGQTYQWGVVNASNWSGSVLQGETSQVLFLDAAFDTTASYYYVDVTNGDCVSRVFFNHPVSLIPQGVAELGGTEEVLVFPNPFADHLQLSRERSTAAAMLRVYDALGRGVKEQVLSVGTETITLDTDQWPAGAYYVHLLNSTSKIVFKVIKL